MEYLIGALVLAALLKFVYDEIKKRKDVKSLDLVQKPEWFDSYSYLSHNPDVAAANLDPWRHYIDYGRAEKRPPYFGVDGDVVAVNQPDFRDIIIQLDFSGSATSDEGGDFNEFNDVHDMLATCEYHKLRPRALIASFNTEGLGIEALKQVVMASGLDIPVLAGNPSFKPGKSEGAQYIADLSNERPIWLAWGGPCNDLRDAKRLGANRDNIKVMGIIADTWNQWTDPEFTNDTLAATSEVYSWLGDRIIDVREYRQWLTAPYGKGEKSVNWNKDWIKRARAVSRLSRLCYSDYINSKNAHLNRHEAAGNPIRIADVMNLLRILNMPTSFDSYIKFKNEVVLEGVKQMEQRPVLTRLSHPQIAVGEPKAGESDGPVTKADFDLANVDMNGFSENPLKFRETAKVKSASIGIRGSSIDHSHKNQWIGVKAEHEGQLITVNSNITLLYVENGKTKALPYEYLRLGATTMHAGASKASPSIRSGDTVGILASTIYRRGDLGQQQGDKERTNIHWLTVK